MPGLYCFLYSNIEYRIEEIFIGHDAGEYLVKQTRSVKAKINEVFKRAMFRLSSES